MKDHWLEILIKLNRHRKLSNGCWIWTGNLNNEGYGRVGYLGKIWKVHALAYYLFKGETHRQINHTCHIRNCFNPEHLYDGFQQENIEDAVHRNGFARFSRRKLTRDQVLELRSLKRVPYKQLAAKYKIGTKALWEIRKGLSYKDL